MRRGFHCLDGVHLFWCLLRRSYFLAERASRRLRAVSPPAHPRAPQGNRRRAAQRLSLVHQLALSAIGKQLPLFRLQTSDSRLSCPSFYGTNFPLLETPLEGFFPHFLHHSFRAAHFFLHRIRLCTNRPIRFSRPQTRGMSAGLWPGKANGAICAK